MSNEQPEHPPATHSQSPANQPEAGSPAAEQRNGHLEDVGSDTPTKPTGQDPPPADELSAQTNDPAGTATTDARLEGQQQDQASDRNDVPARPDTDTVATERTDTSISTQRPGEGDISEAPGALLFSAENGEKLRDQWDSAQTTFVDDPRAAVERADHLVVETIQILSTSFTQERSRIEEQWARGENVSTEDLRVALQRYRSFFDRLLSI